MDEIPVHMSSDDVLLQIRKNYWPKPSTPKDPDVKIGMKRGERIR